MVIIKQENHDFFSNSIMLAVVLFIFSERFHISYRPFKAFEKIADFADNVVVLFLLCSFTTTVRDELRSKIG